MFIWNKFQDLQFSLLVRSYSYHFFFIGKYRIVIVTIILILKLLSLMLGFCSVGFLVALRPWVSNSFDVVDDTFSQWNQPIVQQALSQVIFEKLLHTHLTRCF